MQQFVHKHKNCVAHQGDGAYCVPVMNAKQQVIAREYTTTRSGQECRELVRAGRRYLIARNGRIEDTRRSLGAADARAWYDQAAYQVGPRP